MDGVGNRFAFAAVKQDGSIVTWGEAKFGGDFCNVQGLERTQRR